MNTSVLAQLNKTYVNAENSQIQGICLLCSVENSQNSIDDNENTYASLKIPIGLLASIEQTLVFPKSSTNFRKISIGIGTLNIPIKQLPQGKTFIETYNGQTSNGDYKMVDSNMLKADPTSKKGTIEYTSAKAFDRVKISFHSGLLNLGNELHIYYAHHLPAPFTTCGNPPLDPMAYYPLNNDLNDKIRGLDLMAEDQDSAAYTNE